jgi:Peptidase A4 family
MIDVLRAPSWPRTPMLVATTVIALLCLSSQAAAADRPATRRPRIAGPTILAVRVSRGSLPARGGTVQVSMVTADAASCRVVSVGHKMIGESLARSWTECAGGTAKATVRIGENPLGTSVAAHFRAFARRGIKVTWKPVTILVHAGLSGDPAPTGVVGYPESTNWSGYVVPSSQTMIDSTTGTWAVPTLNCVDTPNADVSEWVGIGGVSWPDGQSSGALLQTGTEDSCIGGSQQDEAWWELYPSNPNESFAFYDLPVAPGDEIVASVRKTSNGRWTTKIDDVTKGIAGVMVTGSEYGTSLDNNRSSGFTKEGSAALFAYSGGYSAEWIVEDARTTPYEFAPFANFGTITFSNLAINLATWSLTPSESVELVQNGVVLSTPSTPSSNGFAVRYTGP